MIIFHEIYAHICCHFINYVRLCVGCERFIRQKKRTKQKWEKKYDSLIKRQSSISVKYIWNTEAYMQIFNGNSKIIIRLNAHTFYAQRFTGYEKKCVFVVFCFCFSLPLFFMMMIHLICSKWKSYITHTLWANWQTTAHAYAHIRKSHAIVYMGDSEILSSV